MGESSKLYGRHLVGLSPSLAAIPSQTGLLAMVLLPPYAREMIVV